MKSFLESRFFGFFLYTKTIAFRYVSMKGRTMELSVSELWMSQPPRESDAGIPDAERMARIVALAITGDRAAFGEIVIQHERRVLALAFRLLGGMEDAKDAAQEVFLRAFKYLRKFDARRPLEPWLVRTTVNVCRELGRKRRQQSVFIQAELGQHVDPRRGPHAELRAGEQRGVLYRALERLGEKERAAIVLRDIEGFTTAEVAAILGSSEATVRSQISVARLKIRKTIERTKGDPR